MKQGKIGFRRWKTPSLGPEKPALTVRLAENCQIRNDLDGMLGQEGGSSIREHLCLQLLRKGSFDYSFSLSRRPLSRSERYSAANDTPVTVFERVKVREDASL